MKENAYDNDAFFAQYSRFPRSVEGLSAAGEWHALRALLPPLTGKRLLDLGCGFGWHCRYAAEQGAAYVLGTDLSEKMLATARAQTQSPVIEYRRLAMEDMDVSPESFDVILSSLALHYVEDVAPVFQAVAHALTPGGTFLFSCEHPIFTAYGNQDWYRDGAGNILHWPVDGYFTQGRREATFLGEQVVKYHKTLTTYLNCLLLAGLTITAVIEPQPDPALLHTVPGMEDELRRRMMLIARAEKPVV